ncbi:hypothetical protein E0W68_03035 [Flavobacterium salilacus subsp. salilacus]|uniref:hypothetical protein n=1 Tax=Flavobacterium TaxID=237 RepID=UPI001074D03B|nr:MULTISPECIES: hypothetical protein [Flavobacterium]KAF2519342.1 hypothetical protein E0W68_03035 [Flavobacterium salilacus subsp. salilacus]MBE1614772.1 hypothetical protein [Flavobacterium sp. SaA2.13]
MKNRIFILFIIFIAIFSSCHKNEKKTESIDYKQLINKKEKLSKIFKEKPLSKTYINKFSILYYQEDKTNISGAYYVKEGRKDSLRIEKRNYNTATVFIYNYFNGGIDTLEIYKDSIKFNSATIEKKSSKKIHFSGTTFNINKFHYSNYLETSNLYIEDSLGLILQRLISQKTAIIEYDHELGFIQKQIEQDSIFFKFEN